MGLGLRIKKFVYYGGSLKDLIFRVGSQKTIYREDFLKKELGKKRGWYF